MGKMMDPLRIPTCRICRQKKLTIEDQDEIHGRIVTGKGVQIRLMTETDHAMSYQAAEDPELRELAQKIVQAYVRKQERLAAPTREGDGTTAT